MGYSFAKTSFDKTSFAKTYTRLVRLNRRMSTATSPREAIKRHTDALIHSSPHHFAELTSKLDGFADRGVMRHLQNLKLKPIGNMWGAESHSLRSSTDSSMCSHLSFNSQRWCSGSVQPCTSRRYDCTPAYKDFYIADCRPALLYILEAQRVDWVMNVRNEWYVPGPGHASFSIGRFNALGLGVLSNAIRVENVFHSEATGLAGPLNWNWNWNSGLLWKPATRISSPVIAIFGNLGEILRRSNLVPPILYHRRIDTTIHSIAISYCPFHRRWSSNPSLTFG